MMKNNSSKPLCIVGTPESFGWMVVRRDKQEVVYEKPNGKLRVFTAGRRILVTRTISPDQVKNG